MLSAGAFLLVFLLAVLVCCRELAALDCLNPGRMNFFPLLCTYVLS
jgi:hypothetical protein